MPLISSFLAGSLLSLLLPVLLLIALIVWYVMFVREVPETADGKRTTAAPAPNPAPSVAVSDEVTRPPDAG